MPARLNEWFQADGQSDEPFLSTSCLAHFSASIAKLLSKEVDDVATDVEEDAILSDGSVVSSVGFNSKRYVVSAC